MSDKTPHAAELLAGADPMSIEELFSRDPLDLTQEDVEEITVRLVRALRAEREAWEQEKAKAKATGRKVSGNTTKKVQKKAALEAIKKESAKIDLGSLIPSKGVKK